MESEANTTLQLVPAQAGRASSVLLSRVAESVPASVPVPPVPAIPAAPPAPLLPAVPPAPPLPDAAPAAPPAPPSVPFWRVALPHPPMAAISGSAHRAEPVPFLEIGILTRKLDLIVARRYQGRDSGSTRASRRHHGDGSSRGAI